MQKEKVQMELKMSQLESQNKKLQQTVEAQANINNNLGQPTKISLTDIAT